MLHRTVEYVEHGYSSGLTKAATKTNRVRRGKCIVSVNDANAMVVANMDCVYPYEGYEVQRVPIGGGFYLVAPLYTADSIRVPGGNVVYQSYLNLEGEMIERVCYPRRYTDWAGKSTIAKLEAIPNLLDRFVAIWRHPWSPELTIPELAERCKSIQFTKRGDWDQPFELTTKEY